MAIVAGGRWRAWQSARLSMPAARAAPVTDLAVAGGQLGAVAVADALELGAQRVMGGRGRSAERWIETVEEGNDLATAEHGGER
jgi:hypothetical protein